jgi:hypothetical protein
MVEATREEMLLDNKFWAFLNGYCILKMNMLLESQSSIIWNLISIFIEQSIRKNDLAAKDATANQN